MIPDWSGSPHLNIAAQQLHQGRVIACPTEAVWGLSCDPCNQYATEKLLQLKNRSIARGLILIAADIHQFDFLLHDLPQAQSVSLRQAWPGPVTWIVPHRNRVPNWISGRHDGVALRVTDHPLVVRLCRLYGGPIVSTSANPQGKSPARTALKVRGYFGRNPLLTMITPGTVGKRQRPSEIRDLPSGAVVRS